MIFSKYNLFQLTIYPNYLQLVINTYSRFYIRNALSIRTLQVYVDEFKMKELAPVSLHNNML